jgi:hypothetical protein
LRPAKGSGDEHTWKERKIHTWKERKKRRTRRRSARRTGRRRHAAAAPAAADEEGAEGDAMNGRRSRGVKWWGR